MDGNIKIVMAIAGQLVFSMCNLCCQVDSFPLTLRHLHQTVSDKITRLPFSFHSTVHTPLSVIHPLTVASAQPDGFTYSLYAVTIKLLSVGNWKGRALCLSFLLIAVTLNIWLNAYSDAWLSQPPHVAHTEFGSCTMAEDLVSFFAHWSKLYWNILRLNFLYYISKVEWMDLLKLVGNVWELNILKWL